MWVEGEKLEKFSPNKLLSLYSTIQRTSYFLAEPCAMTVQVSLFRYLGCEIGVQ